MSLSRLRGTAVDLNWGEAKCSEGLKARRGVRGGVVNGTLLTAMCRGYCGAVGKAVTTRSPPLHTAQVFVSRSYVHLDRAAVLFTSSEIDRGRCRLPARRSVPAPSSAVKFLGRGGFRDNLHESNRLDVPSLQVVGHVPEPMLEAEAGPVSILHGDQLA